VEQAIILSTHSNHLPCQQVLDETIVSKKDKTTRNFVSFLTEIRLKEKDGTHKTSIRIKEAEIITVPISVTETSWPFGSLTNLEVVAVIVVKNEREQTIWLVAPVSIIHS
jgi:hypothetical protein